MVIATPPLRANSISTRRPLRVPRPGPRLLDRRRHLEEGERAPDIPHWLQTHPSPLAYATAAFAITAPSGKLRAVAVMCEVFVIFRHFVGCVVAGSAAEQTLTLAGDGFTVGWLNLGGWRLVRDVRTMVKRWRDDGQLRVKRWGPDGS